VTLPVALRSTLRTESQIRYHGQDDPGLLTIASSVAKDLAFTRASCRSPKDCFSSLETIARAKILPVSAQFDPLLRPWAAPSLWPTPAWVSGNLPNVLRPQLIFRRVPFILSSEALRPETRGRDGWESPSTGIQPRVLLKCVAEIMTAVDGQNADLM
jgi:hypothetical protein